MKLNLSLLFLLASLGCFFWVLNLVWQRYVPLNVAFNQIPTSSPISGGLVANGIILPDLNISLPVFPGELSHGIWPVTSRGVIYLSSTPQPGTFGNSVIYGHNWPNLLGKLRNAQLGQKVLIHYANGLTKTFIISTISEVLSTDMTILKPTSGTRLTIYTCTGFLDTKRLVVTATPA